MPTLLIDIPHADSVLFKRIRNWLCDKEKTVALRPEWRQSLGAMLDDMKAKKLLLLFARADREAKMINRSNLYTDTTGSKVIELYVAKSSPTSREINDTELGYLAQDALDLFAKSRGPLAYAVRAPNPDLAPV